MNTGRKVWLIAIVTVIGMAIIACSTSTVLPTATRAPQVPLAPVATVAPLATSAPQPVTNQEPMPGLVGKWIDPDSSGGGTVSTIEYQNGQYVVTSVINTNRGPNELTTTSWANGVLTWEYCPAGMHCITQKTVSISGDTLVVDWAWSDGGNSGTSPLQRQP